MGEFLYKAIDREGHNVAGIIQANNLEYARKQLRNSYRHTLEIKPRPDIRPATRGVKSMSLQIYTQQLAAMIDAGVPVVRATEMLLGGDDRKMNMVLEQVLQSLLAGRQLHSSLSDYPEVFPRIYTSLVATAEATGKLHVVLTKLSELLEREEGFKRRILATFSYPIALMVLAMCMCSLMVFYILPVLKPMFSQAGMELPGPTLALITIADGMRSPWTWVTVVVLAALLGYATRRLMGEGNDEPGGLRYRFDYFLLHVPLLGRLLELSIASRLLFSMALMLEAGMRLTDLLRIVEHTMGNAYVRNGLRRCRHIIMEGNMLAEALESERIFRGGAMQMLRVGEEAGRLDEMMRLVGGAYEQDLDLTLNRVGATLEPILMGLMGVVIGFICIASLLPVLKFVQQI